MDADCRCLEQAGLLVVLWMNDEDVDFANVVENQDYVCGGEGGAGCTILSLLISLRRDAA